MSVSPPLPPAGGAAGRRAARGRATDRRITAAGLVVAGLFLAAAVAAVLLPVEVRHGAWLPLHLALAGAATTAIGAALPYFTSALAAAPPADPRLRVVVLVLLAGGALGITGGVASGSWMAAASLAPIGGAGFVAGIGGLAWAAFAPLRGGLGRRRPLVLAAYAIALADVAAGATLATLYVGGYEPVLAAWDRLLPVHAWLNLYGFVSLAVAGTLVHLFPTVLGTRIRGGRAAAGLVAGLGLGPPLVAGGFLLASDLLARLGALVELGGAAALLVELVAVGRSRGRWTSDAGWHRLTGGSLTLAAGWFAVGVAIGAGRILAFGTAPGAWSLVAVAAPLAVGWIAQAILGAWSHLAPAIGPGGPEAHAGQRALLGRLSALRLAALQAGTGLLAVGLPLGSLPLTLGGGIVAGAAVLASLGLLLGAVRLAGTFPDPAAVAGRG